MQWVCVCGVYMWVCVWVCVSCHCAQRVMRANTKSLLKGLQDCIIQFATSGFSQWPEVLSPRVPLAPRLLAIHAMLPHDILGRLLFLKQRSELLTPQRDSCTMVESRFEVTLANKYRVSLLVPRHSQKDEHRHFSCFVKSHWFQGRSS